jgi:hypothetical protein
MRVRNPLMRAIAGTTVVAGEACTEFGFDGQRGAPSSLTDRSLRARAPSAER